MPSSPAFRRRRGHQQTPVVVGLFWLVCTLGTGLMTIARDAKRAEKVGAVLSSSDKWSAFAHGCAWGTGLFFAFLAALFLILGITAWLENWRCKREKAKPREEP